MRTPEPMIPTFETSLARALRAVLDPIARELLPAELERAMDRLRQAEAVSTRVSR